MAKVLIVDDQQSILDVLSIMLKREGYEVLTALSGEEALDIVRNDTIDLAIADLKMTPMDGIGVLEGIKGIDPEIVVVMMTAYASIQTAIDAMKKALSSTSSSLSRWTSFAFWFSEAWTRSPLSGRIGISSSRFSRSTPSTG